MGRTADRGEDFVVDLVVEVESRGVDVDAVARAVRVPGVEILRTTGQGMIWLTALVSASGEPAAIRQVQDSVLAALSDSSRVVVASVVASAPLGDLYGRLDEVVSDAELALLKFRLRALSRLLALTLNTATPDALAETLKV